MRALPVLPLLLLPATALAFAPTTDQAEAPVELASGAPVRIHLEVEHGPQPERAPWRAFVDRHGGRWRVTWDRDTRVPLRIWGSGISAPGSTSSAEAALKVARAMLRTHVDLLAPGAAPSDFVLAANVLSDGVRSVGFFQTKNGLPVEGGQVSFRFKNDRLVALASESFPHLDVEIGRRISDDAASAAALRWMGERRGEGTVESVGTPRIRAVVRADGDIEAAHVIPVMIRTERPIGRWEVDVLASSGRPFARRQTLLFAAGEIRYRVPERHPRSGRIDAPAKRAQLVVDGAGFETDDDGIHTWTSSGAVTVRTGVVGPMVRVVNDAGATATTTFTLEDGAVAIWDESDDEIRDAQLTTFVAAREARDYVKAIAPGLRFLDQQILATVNIADTCNAFSDGVTINFLRAGNDCENTGRLSDVVMHEYAHSIHAHAVIPGVGRFESALSEGASDFLPASITNDPGMGRGFFYTDDPLRHLDPAGREARWPEDRGEPHVTGLIYAGAMWDLRKLMIEKYGEEAGVALVDRLWYGVLQRSSDILTAYVEVLVGDDDDGDLANGTPNLCDITEVFRAHGLTDGAQAGLEIGQVSLDRFRVSIPVTDRGLCPGIEIAGAQMTWALRGHDGVGGRVEMTRNVDSFEATIPPQPEGEVLRYGVVLTMGSGERLHYPDNPADPLYESFIGEVTPIYCTDFEIDPTEEGWTSELIQAGGRRARNEWEWGVPEDRGSGDPSEAYSGERVVGNDLGLQGRGTYRRRQIEELVSPAIDAAGHQKVRLHYRRWLTVEDGDFDQAEIIAGGETLWANAASGTGDVHHVDREWRFHDVDLTTAAAQGPVQVTFRLTSDENLQLGGWTLDDFCLMGWNGPVARCGDGALDHGELCDDGNSLDGDGCQADCTDTPAAACGNGVVEGAEACDDGNGEPGDGCEPSCVVTPMKMDPVPVAPALEDEEAGCACNGSGSGGRSSLLMLLGLCLFVRRLRRA